MEIIKKIQEILNKIFGNIDNVIKLVSKVFFAICVIGAILYLVLTMFMFELEDYVLVVVPTLLLSSLASLPIYALGEIVSQLKEINEKIK